MKCCDPKSITRNDERGYPFSMTVPCGRCYACRYNLTEQWITRLDMEARYSDYPVYFLTLTYREDSAPRNKYGDTTLSKRDLQLYMKRLRQKVERGFTYVFDSDVVHVDAHPGANLRYLAIGEYGGKTVRAHYHMLLFNCPLSKRDTHAAVLSSWRDGNIRVGSATPKRVAYCASFHINKFQSPPDREAPFSLPSRNPGIGYSYLLSEQAESHINGVDGIDMYCNTRGRLVPVPTYLKRKMYPEGWPHDYPMESLEIYLKRKYSSYFRVEGLLPSDCITQAKKAYKNDLKMRELKQLEKHGKYISDDRASEDTAFEFQS